MGWRRVGGGGGVGVFQEAVTLPDQLEQAENYIKKLRSNLEQMKQKKERLLSSEENQDFSYYSNLKKGETSEVDFPKIEIYEKGSVLEVILITRMNYQFIFSETIRILHEEGVEVVNASFSVFDGIVFHTIHSKVGEVGMDNAIRTTRISERLKNFVYGSRLVIIRM
ncbi:hypothetical protein LIER_26557 [Lithospermum erythrorhizon]|uniref:Uncharacterized protein n=1 Tax=Lithospermum erythrorhizon TaxID=34254 RepID=A0AAV3R912_LITER